MNPTPTNLPPSVAHNFGDRDTVDGVIEQIGFEMNQGYLSPKNGALVKAAQDRVRELAARAADPAPVRELLLVRNGVHDRLQVTAEPSRDGSTLIVCVADPAPVADEAAIEAWERDWDAATRTLHFRIQRDEFDGVRAMGARAVRLMRAAPRNDDGRLRKLLDLAKFVVDCDDFKKSPSDLLVVFDGRFVQDIRKLLAESPAGEWVEKAQCDTIEGALKETETQLADCRDTVSAQQQTIDSVIVACDPSGSYCTHCSGHEHLCPNGDGRLRYPAECAEELAAKPEAAQEPVWSEPNDHTKNVCAIRRRSDGYWWQCNSEHGAGWDDKRIRQAWTAREARLEVERHLQGQDVEIVQLMPEPKPEAAAATDAEREGDAVLSRWLALDKSLTQLEWLALMSVVVDELCRRALRGGR